MNSIGQNKRLYCKNCISNTKERVLPNAAHTFAPACQIFQIFPIKLYIVWNICHIFSFIFFSISSAGLFSSEKFWRPIPQTLHSSTRLSRYTIDENISTRDRRSGFTCRLTDLRKTWFLSRWDYAKLRIHSF